MRRGYLVPLNVMWSSDVPPAEARAALEGIVDAVQASGQQRTVAVYGAHRWSDGGYSSADWYVEEAKRRQSVIRNLGYGPQVHTGHLFEQFHEEPWQASPHWEVAIVNADLYDNRTNFVYGATKPDFAASIQSIRRLREVVQDDVLRAHMVRRLLRHEVGHMFGLPGDGRPNTAYKLGTHCTNICTMRQGMNMQEWVQLTLEEVAAGVQFCGDCMDSFARVRGHYKPLPQ